MSKSRPIRRQRRSKAVPRRKSANGNGAFVSDVIKKRPAPIEISEPLRWVDRYIRRAKKHMPSLILPRKIRSYRPPVHREMRVLGTCAVETKVITLGTHRHVMVNSGKRPKRRQVAIAQRELLMTLAHEMAHLRYEFHDYEQESYARTIFQAFGLKDKCIHCAGTGRIPARYVN